MTLQQVIGRLRRGRGAASRAAGASAPQQGPPSVPGLSDAMARYISGVAAGTDAAPGVIQPASDATPARVDAFPRRSDAQPTPARSAPVQSRCATDSRSVLERIRSLDFEPGERSLAWKSPAEHAEALIMWIAESTPAGSVETTVHAEMLPIYADMCAELYWEPRAWNPIAAELAKRLGGKTYIWRRGHRLRAYHVPGARHFGAGPEAGPDAAEAPDIATGARAAA